MQESNDALLILCDMDNVDKECVSPNSMKTRLALAHKGFSEAKGDFRTDWISLPDLRRHLIEDKGVVATGQPGQQFTIPHLTHGDVNVTDSTDIALYLEKTFPDRPSLFPSGDTLAFSRVLNAHIFQNIGRPLLILLMPRMYNQLDDNAKPYYKRTREAFSGLKISNEIFDNKEEVEKAWTQATPALKMLNTLYEDSSVEGPYLAGKVRAYPDLLVLAYLQWFKRCGEKDIFAKALEIAPALQNLWDAAQDILA